MPLEQLLIILFLVVLPLVELVGARRRARDRAASGEGAESSRRERGAEDATGREARVRRDERVRATSRPPAPSAPRREHAPAAVLSRPARRIVAPAGLRRAIVGAAAIEPCRAIHPWSPPGSSTAKGDGAAPPARRVDRADSRQDV